MSDLYIGDAPQKYHGALLRGDLSSGKPDHKINSKYETETAAEYFCHVDPTNCQEFLGYLEKSTQNKVKIETVWPKAYAKEKIETKIENFKKSLLIDKEDKYSWINNALYEIERLTLSAAVPLKAKEKMAEILFAVLEKRTEKGRGLTAVILGYFAHPKFPNVLKARVIISLTKALEDARVYVRTNAVASLAKFASLPNISPELKVRMAKSLMKLGDKDGNYKVKYNVKIALRRLASSQNISLLTWIKIKMWLMTSSFIKY